ncbi:hypothetical protein EVG20_g9551 [Dentipellis fragilis]|uniref:Uncharacterized protein n=1 Tax=Dentipellis fragilis TaxID=205917 RepID=A0A4Y9XXE6_9AGAM|nr:hypothetical protein EVG20_g9551 [Dentipellis fragilis]
MAVLVPHGNHRRVRWSVRGGRLMPAHQCASALNAHRLFFLLPPSRHSSPPSRHSSLPLVSIHNLPRCPNTPYVTFALAHLVSRLALLHQQVTCLCPRSSTLALQSFADLVALTS